MTSSSTLAAAVKRNSWTRRHAASGLCSGMRQTPYTASSPNRARKRSTNCGALSRLAAPAGPGKAAGERAARPRAQAYHKLRLAAAPARAGESGKDIERTCRQTAQGTGNEFHASNRRAQIQPRQFLAKHIAQAAPFAGDAGQAQLHTRCRPFPMLQFQLQCLDTGLALAQESRAALDQGLERFFQVGHMLDLRFEITALPKALTPHECPARRRLPRQRNV